MRYEEIGDFAAIELEDSVFTFEDTRVDRSELIKNFEQKNVNLEWDDQPIQMDNYKIFPNGENNQMPRTIRALLKHNPIGTRVLKKRLLLAYGKGPYLYREQENEEGDIKRLWMVNHPEITPWLKSFNHRKYLLKVIEDFIKGEAQASKTIQSRGIRIGRSPRIARIEHVPAGEVRLACPSSQEEDIANLAIIGDWDYRFQKDWKIYPLADEENFTEHPVAIHYSGLYTYMVKQYPLPDIMSVGPWMRRFSAVPFILENFIANNLTIRWHIKIPQAYWDAKEKEIQKLCQEKGITYKTQMLIDFKRKRKREIAQVLAGAHNSGKYVTTESVKQIVADRLEVTHEWEFEPIDQKVKDYIDANLSVSKHAGIITSAGLGMHQALSNISMDGKSDSGSEQLYAWMNYVMSELDVPEEFICATINQAIEINWPNSGIRIGFRHEQPKRQQDETPNDRHKNQKV